MSNPTPSVSIAFVGDVFLGPRPSISLEPQVAAALRASQLTVANQEGPITTATQPVGGKTCLKSAPESARILHDWGVSLVTLANNHMFDYAWEGFEQTRQSLHAVGIAHVGAGADLDEATQPLIRDIDGLRVGFLAYAWERAETTCATEVTYGCAPLDTDLMIAQVTELSKRVDVVMVMPHWGYCDYKSPIPEQLELADRLLDGGATAVVGHHSHVVHGLVTRSHRVAAYSLGNFAFARFDLHGQPVDMSNDNYEGIVLTLHCARHKVISHDVLHTIVRNDRIFVDHSQRRREAFRHISALLASPDYATHWQRVVRRRLIARVLYWADVRNWGKIRKATLRGGWIMLKHLLLRR